MNFDELVAGYLEGDLSAGDRARLKSMLEADPELWRRFAEELQLHEAVKIVSREAPAGGGSEFVENVLSAWKAPAKKTARRVYRAPVRKMPLLAAAAVLLAVAAAAVLLRPKNAAGPPAPVASDPEAAAREAERRRRERLEEEKRLEEIERFRREALARQAQAEEEERKRLEERIRELDRERQKIEEKRRLVQDPPPAPPAPAPVPQPPDPAPAPGRTAVVAAALLQVRGEAFILGEGARKAAQRGQPLLAGDGLETVGPRSSALVEFPDGTQVELGGDTRISRLAGAEARPGPGKRLNVDHGSVSADVAKQPPDQPMVLTTPHGEARVLGTSLVVTVDLAGTGSTILEVDEGRVRFTRLRDGLAVEVSSGHYAIAAVGVELSARPFVQEARKKRAAHPKVDPVRADSAIQRGVAYLKTEHPRHPYAATDQAQCPDELVLWTYVHAGVPESDPEFARLLKAMLQGELKFTYRVALQAMILEQVDRVRFQGRIQQCAQFLVDNQLRHGQWTYGEPSPFVADVQPPKDAATGAKARPKGPELPPGLRPKPRVLRKVPVVQRRVLERGGDNSNTQYAALGLRACHEAGILIPREVIDLAVKWWARLQYDDEKHLKAGPVGKGWAYGYDLLEWSGSMTAGAAGSLVIYDYMLGQDWTKDKLVADGLAWLAANFSATQNPGRNAVPVLAYYLYALERLGLLYGTEFVGKHEWYPEGARSLLEIQRADGSWKPGDNPIYDTCFAILFLRRATAPLGDVASVDRVKRR